MQHQQFQGPMEEDFDDMENSELTIPRKEPDKISNNR